MTERVNMKLNGWLIRIIIGLAAFIFGAGVAWGLINGKVNDVCDKVDDHERRIRVVEKGVTEANGKLDFLVEQAKEKK